MIAIFVNFMWLLTKFICKKVMIKCVNDEMPNGVETVKIVSPVMTTKRPDNFRRLETKPNKNQTKPKKVKKIKGSEKYFLSRKAVQREMSNHHSEQK